MSFRIEISPDQEDVTLHVIGHFDLAVGFAFWQYCEPERQRHKRYLFNLTGVSDLRDSWIGWLLMFSKRARALGAHLTLVNSTSGFDQRCIAAGIPIEACVSPAKPASMAVRFERDLSLRVQVGENWIGGIHRDHDPAGVQAYARSDPPQELEGARLGAEVNVVHVYQVAAYALADSLFEMPAEVVGELGRIKEQLDQFVAAKARPGVNSMARPCGGLPYVEIVRAAKDAAADMIVVGTHGRTGLNLLVSSVAERLVRTCSTPGRAV